MSQINVLRLPSKSALEPTLSIIVCAYNHAKYIVECLASIDNIQNRRVVELIVIDDGSRDATLDIVLEFPFSPDLAVSIVRKPNAGLTNSLKLGLQLARGRYFMIIASDDYYLPGAIDQLLGMLHQVVGDPICWVMQAHFTGDLSGPVYGRATATLLGLGPAARFERLATEYPKPLLLQSTVFDRTMLAGVGAWRDELLLDDWPTFIRVAEAALAGQVNFAFRPELVLCAYRVHIGGIHNNTDRQLRACLEVARTAVPVRWRACAIANVYSDLGLVHLAEGRPRAALSFYARAVRADPGLASMLRLPGRVLRGIGKRAARVAGRARWTSGAEV